jgi:hypothetical protein
VKDRATGHYTTIYDDYLEVKWRLCWFRDRYPHGSIETQEVCVDLERGYARYRCVVEDGQGGKATGYGTETKADFADYAERAETRAIGRALAALGIGTQFVDLAELPHVADAPVASANGQAPPPSSNGDAPTLTTIPPETGELPTSIPAGLQLPCAEALIVDLRPPQLSLLIGKVGLKALADKTLEPLHVALLAERARRLAHASQQRVAVEGDGHVP